MLIHGPCCICGDINYPPSMGGPTICPSCDCGDFGIDKVKRQAAIIIDLRAKIDAIEECVQAHKYSSILEQLVLEIIEGKKDVKEAND